MKSHWRSAAAALAAVLILGPSHRAAGESPQEVIAHWRGPAKRAAEAMILEYGAPDRVDADSLLWRDNGPWKWTVVYADSYHGVDSSTPDTVIQQGVAYRVPDDRFAEVDSFDLRLVADRRRGELSFRSDSEKLNFLAINAANEIVHRQKTVGEARELFRRQAELILAGKNSPYVAGLMFPEAVTTPP